MPSPTSCLTCTDNRSSARSNAGEKPPSVAGFRLATSCGRSSRNHPIGSPVDSATTAISSDRGKSSPDSIATSRAGEIGDPLVVSAMLSSASSRTNAIRCAIFLACLTASVMRKFCHILRCRCQRSLKSSPKRSSKSSPSEKDWMGDFFGTMGTDPVPAWAGVIDT